MPWHGRPGRRGHRSITGSFSWRAGYWSRSITISGTNGPKKFLPSCGLSSYCSRPGSTSGTEYYLAVVIALLSAVCIHFVFEKGWGDLRQLATGIMPPATADSSKDAEKAEPHRGAAKKKKQRKGTGSSPKPDYPVLAVVAIVFGLSLLFAFTSLSYNYQIGSSGVNQMNPDWKGALEWLGNNTPDTGVNYYTIYDPKTFQYPSTAYGIMSWWDYGHMITYIAHRIPNANPFQQGVTGPNGSAAYFMSTDENTANAILDADGTRYVITDIEMDTGKFWAMATWYNTTVAGTPYQTNMLYPSQTDPSQYNTVTLNEEPYYQTMVSRLHNFDGSMTPATSAFYVEYADPTVTQASLPVMTDAEVMNVSDAATKAEQYNLNAQAGHHATVLSLSIYSAHRQHSCPAPLPSHLRVADKHGKIRHR